jgi:coenzyme F420 hydrogenase subunit beta
VSPTPQSITEVAERQLCLGCGACAYVQPDAIRMVDDFELGRRPVVDAGPDGEPSTKEALSVCPGLELERRVEDWDEGWDRELAEAWGPVLEIWEGYASDPEIRYAGSSGGIATALALHCLDHEDMDGVLHIAARPEAPFLNHTVLSTSHDEMLAATGSRYAPASPCDSLDKIEAADRPCVFIGKPCDVAATQRARRERPDLDRKLGLTIAMFCAGTPSTRGTLEMIEAMGFDDPGQVRSVRYRGNGWPGSAEITGEIDGVSVTRQLSYEESWGAILQKHRPWRCRVCVDHTGEFADVTVGDPWHRVIEGGELGRSLVIARTERGRTLIRRAIASGALHLEPADSTIVIASQPNLLTARGAAWGRMTGGRMVGMKAPRYRGMSTFRVWWRTHNTDEKARTILSTVRRRLNGRLSRKVRVTESSGEVDPIGGDDPRRGPHVSRR